ITRFSGSSFLRIGSSPDPTADWGNATFQNSVNLARLVGDAASIQRAEGITVSPQTMTITQGGADKPNASTLATNESSNSFGDGFQDGTGITTTGYGSKGDPNYMLGFADDTRYHGDGSGLTRSPEKTLVNGV